MYLYNVFLVEYPRYVVRPKVNGQSFQRSLPYIKGMYKGMTRIFVKHENRWVTNYVKRSTNAIQADSVCRVDCKECNCIGKSEKPTPTLKTLRLRGTSVEIGPEISWKSDAKKYYTIS